MTRVGKFEKVSFEQFCEAYKDTFGGSDDEIKRIYDSIELPNRATAGSAGYAGLRFPAEDCSPRDD